MAQRIPAVDPDKATGEVAQMFLEAREQFGRIPNILKTLGNSPAALRGYLTLAATLGKGQLPAAVQEQIAIAIAEANCCDYCLSAHTAIGKMAGLNEDDVAAARRSKAEDPKTEAALQFVHKLVLTRGNVGEPEIALLRNAGYGDGEIVEIISQVALNTFTNYLNLVARTDVDFPKMQAGQVPTAV